VDAEQYRGGTAVPSLSYWLVKGRAPKMKWLMIVLVAAVGVLAAVVAALYFAEPARSLPAFLPGHVSVGHGHRYKRGSVAAVGALILFVVAFVMATSGRRRVASV
jgi:drug/metabolite transporter (DMT)-like permease